MSREDQKATLPVDIYRGLDAYQASDILTGLGCPQKLNSALSRTMISFWDLFISTGMETAEINPWRITPDGNPVACDFKAVIDEANYKSKVPGMVFPSYPDTRTEFEEEMSAWNAASHQGQAHVSDLHGRKILPLLFGGGVSRSSRRRCTWPAAAPSSSPISAATLRTSGCWAPPASASSTG